MENDKKWFNVKCGADGLHGFLDLDCKVFASSPAEAVQKVIDLFNVDFYTLTFTIEEEEVLNYGNMA